MKFLEMAQLIAATQAAEKGDIEFSEEHTQAAPDPALVEMFTNMVAEMFDYGRTILESRRKDPKDDLFSKTKIQCRRAVKLIHGIKDIFSTGSQNQNPPQPSS